MRVAAVEASSAFHLASVRVAEALMAVPARTDSATKTTASARRLLEQFTERERAVALAVGQGLTNSQISEQEYLSVATVKAEIIRILGKLSVVVIFHAELVEDPRNRPGHRQGVVEWHRQALGASGSQTFADLNEFVERSRAPKRGYCGPPGCPRGGE